MTEKRTPTYDLGSFKAWAQTSSFVATGTATRTAAELGLNAAQMVQALQTIERNHFDKSMTSYANNKEWQDVYHVPSDVGTLYIKFRADVVTEFLLLSFKEKDNG
ncbi:type II toxin-antitoxin system MqsR family toxin [Methylobacterium sp. WSM2598]|uniref:type II toxin-antitoxin system MqsR family toxin n=1 Tax=Methylobacterium sp. WSM2598 TaxID=398261 RepID=UPI000A047AD5|nr:type II toxin-antitoxin system MqsR family toxin [Methylobacterium sp. WSM2598]